ncbi:AAA family ATPase [Pseudomonas alliivorans]|nr:AAA family ATPase [Pseudomonas alliivorans]
MRDFQYRNQSDNYQGSSMIIGTFIKNYKIYQHITFLPFIKSADHKLSIFIGKNGAGKSSILEALDTLFNDREWISNIASKKADGYICPIFLIPKRQVRSSKSIENLSNYFWNYRIPENSGAIRYESWKDFIEFRETLKQNINHADYYLIVIGYDEQRNLSYTSTHQNLKNSLKEKGVGYNEQCKLLESTLNRYAFTYLPIHSSPTQLLDLKAKELQALLDKNFIREIESILTKDEESAVSPIKNINLKLENFISEINKKLQDMDGSYQYKNSQSSRVSSSDITDIIINKFISKRPLQKDGKPIHSLSSGEQRVAIIDVAYAFLSKSTDTSKELIIAIDEPEVSLSPTNCLNQFKRIFSISKDFNKQVLVSTHWYGLLMAPAEATLNHITRIDEKPVLKSLDLSKIQEERRNFPDSFEMKSYFDLVSSILSVIKGSPQNWLICEGNDDSNYFKAIVADKIENLNILPIGGRGGVIKVYEYMRIAAEDKAERGLLKGKVLCVIDSDTEIIEVASCSYKAQKSLKILRFQNLKNKKSDLVPVIVNGYYTQTELEDTLDPEDFYNASRHIVRSEANEDIKRAFLAGKANKAASYAGINYDLDFLQLENSDHYLKNDIKLFFSQDHVKSDISKRYAAIHAVPQWAETVVNFFDCSPPESTLKIENMHEQSIKKQETEPELQA